MKVWKVTYCGVSCCALFTDCTHDRRLILKYSVGKVTQPKIGKLFVFKTLGKLTDYIRNNFCQNISVLPICKISVFYGEATNLRIKHSRSAYFDRDSIQKFWNKKGYFYGINTSGISGTYVCDSFLPEKQYKGKELAKLLEKYF